MDDDSGGCFLVAAIGLMAWGVIWGAIYFYKHHTEAIEDVAKTAVIGLAIGVAALLVLFIIGVLIYAFLGDWIAHQWKRFWLWVELEEQKNLERRRVHHTAHLLYVASREFQHAINEIKKWKD
ncbi:hypothetical protein AB5J52_06870 [Streptomyces sp. R39]|uniref:DUF4190 domain-containing protein n=1 Tax=Streptomyces sp. R39 TaxID=3238631 RepID=A0AB39QKF6_9ACTN